MAQTKPVSLCGEIGDSSNTRGPRVLVAHAGDEEFIVNTRFGRRGGN